MVVALHKMIAAELRVDVRQVGVGGGGEALVPHEAGQLGVDITRLTELAVVGEGVEQLGEALQLHEQVAGLVLVQPPQNVDTGAVNHCGRRVPSSLAQKSAQIEA